MFFRLFMVTVLNSNTLKNTVNQREKKVILRTFIINWGLEMAEKDDYDQQNTDEMNTDRLT